MIGWSGTLSDMSGLTVIFWPCVGTLMCWYMGGNSPDGGQGLLVFLRAAKPWNSSFETVASLSKALICRVEGQFPTRGLSTVLPHGPLRMSLPSPGRNFSKNQLHISERISAMTKLLAVLIGSFFAVSTAFAASHVGAPMAAASGAKPAAAAEAKTDKMEAKADKKAAKKKTSKKAAKKAAPKAEEKKS